MTLEKNDFIKAQQRAERSKAQGHAVFAEIDAAQRLRISFHNGLELALPIDRIEGLAGAASEALCDIEISPSGLGVSFPQLDVDIYLPALLQGIFGSKSWMAQQLGAMGGQSTSHAKKQAARENGRKGGRPRKLALA